MGVIIFWALVVVLFFLSRNVTRELSYFLFQVFRHKSVVVWIFSLLFLPGTVIHELSHFFTAILTGVKVGKIELMPELREGGGMKLGSVEVAKCDPVRGLLIGVAPIFAGMGVIIAVLYGAQTYALDYWMYGVVFYVLFVVGNTMHSSRKDMEGLWLFVGMLVVIGLLIGFLGFFGPVWETLVSLGVEDFFDWAWKYIAVPVGIDLGLLLIFFVIRRVGF